MATAVETLEKLERRIVLSVPVQEVRAEVEKELKKRAKTARAPGFRPGKVPMKMVEQQHGYQVESAVLNDKVGQAFNAAATENNLRVAGMPKIEQKKGADNADVLQFSATFEVYPEVKIGDLANAEVEKVSAAVGLHTLRQAGLEKVAAGLTTIEEVSAVLPPRE